MNIHGKAVIINYNTFSLGTSVMVVENGYITQQQMVDMNMEELSRLSVDIAHTNDISDVYIKAPLAFTDEFSRQVQEEEQNHYSCNKIIVKGI